MLKSGTLSRRIAVDSMQVVGAMLAVQGLLVFFNRELAVSDFLLVTAVLLIVRTAIQLSRARGTRPNNAGTVGPNV